MCEQPDLRLASELQVGSHANAMHAINPSAWQQAAKLSVWEPGLKQSYLACR